MKTRIKYILLIRLSKYRTVKNEINKRKKRYGNIGTEHKDIKDKKNIGILKKYNNNTNDNVDKNNNTVSDIAQKKGVKGNPLYNSENNENMNAEAEKKEELNLIY